MDKVYSDLLDKFRDIAKEILVISGNDTRPLRRWISEQDTILCNFMLVLAGERLGYLVNYSKSERIDSLLQVTEGKLTHIRRRLGKYDASFIVRSDRVDEFWTIMNGKEDNMEKTGNVLGYPYSASYPALRSWKFLTTIRVRKENVEDKNAKQLYCFASPRPVDISERIERYNDILNHYGYIAYVEYSEKRSRI